MTRWSRELTRGQRAHSPIYTYSPTVSLSANIWKPHRYYHWRNIYPTTWSDPRPDTAIYLPKAAGLPLFQQGARHETIFAISPSAYMDNELEYLEYLKDQFWALYSVRVATAGGIELLPYNLHPWEQLDRPIGMMRGGGTLGHGRGFLLLSIQRMFVFFSSFFTFLLVLHCI